MEKMAVEYEEAATKIGELKRKFENLRTSIEALMESIKKTGMDLEAWRAMRNKYIKFENYMEVLEGKGYAWPE